MRWWEFGVEVQGNEVVVRAELPDFEEKDLDVQLHDNLLTIRAERQEENGQERRSSSFRRTITPAARHRSRQGDGDLMLHPGPNQ